MELGLRVSRGHAGGNDLDCGGAVRRRFVAHLDEMPFRELESVICKLC